MFSMFSGSKKAFISGVVQADVGEECENFSKELADEVDNRFFDVRFKFEGRFFLKKLGWKGGGGGIGITTKLFFYNN